MSDSLSTPTHPSQSPQPLSPIYLTELEASKLLRVSKQTLQRIRFRNEISFSRIGGSRVLYTREAILKYIESREISAI